VNDVRIGSGWDRHLLAVGRPCRLGGVVFPECDVGPVGHSDGDALAHAIIDALLGAATLGDIGRHYPDTDPAWRDADSLDLLARTAVLIADAGWRVANVDTTVITERPRLAPRIEDMRGALAGAMGVEIGRVSVKATRGEGVGPEGRGECVTAMAVALLEPSGDGGGGS